MKKSKLFYTAVLLLIACFLFPAAVMAEDMQVKVNGELLITDVPPVIKDYRTLVPMRAICEKLGAVVNYSAADQSVVVQKGAVSLTLYLGSTKAVINGNEITLDVAPDVIEQRTMLPLRFLGESFNCSVNWIAESNLVTVDEVALDADAVAEELLDIINRQRAAIDLQPLLLAKPLEDMAFLQARELALSKKLSHISATRGDLEQRSQQAGLVNVSELLSAGSYDAQSIWNEWINIPEYRALLYAEDVSFAGIHACYSPAKGADDLYVCLELVRGDGFFVNDRKGGFAAGEIVVNGFAYAENARMVVYVLNPENPELYLKRFSHYITPAEDKSFSYIINLQAGGLFAVCIGNDRLTIDLR